jgi:acetylornithine deacetylase/succinyl-diaminopimelate desuccinylase-like protein
MTEQTQVDRVLAAIDGPDLIDLTLALGQINSPPGREAEVAEYVLVWLAANDIAAYRQTVLPERYNVIGTLPGSGGGQSLILNSHFDTAYGDPMDVWTAGRLTKADMSAWLEDDRIYGQGVVNDKAPMAATLMALKALKQVGVPLKGDLIFTGVAGEIGRAPVDEYQGPNYEGKGIGTRYAVTHGVVADYALVAECTNWTYTAVECGCLLVKITVRGTAIYTPFLKRPDAGAIHPNAIVQAARLIEAIEVWAQDYEARFTYRSPTGLVVPKASVGAIRGGLPYKPIETAGVCALYLDIRVPPNVEPLVPLHELRDLIAELDLTAEVEPYLFRRGYEGQHIDGLQDAIVAAHQQFFAEPPGEPEPPVSSMWRDLNVFNEIGIPAMTYGPPLGLSSEGWTYFIKTDDIIRAAQLYALIALDICNRAR